MNPRPLHTMRAGAIALLGAAGCSAALAWGPDGHQTVGKLADGLLKGSHAGTRARTLLGMSLQQASLWADCAKGVFADSSGKLFYHSDLKRFPECKPFETPAEKAAMVAFVGRNLKACKPLPDEDPCHKQYHYTDVALQRDHYELGEVGTSDHDIVGAIAAAAAVLQGLPAPAPFDIRSKREALLLLAHYLGDVHQPLHVQAVYLDAQGHPVDPDEGGFDRHTRTIGGNATLDGSQSLHHEWDSVALPLRAAKLGTTGVAEARAVARSSGPLAQWSAQWATDTIGAAGPAFAGVSYSAQDGHRHWAATLPPGYAAARDDLQRAQLLKAGARLAELLRTIWP